MGVFSCPSCSQAIPFSEKDAGRDGVCPSCREPVRAPEHASVADTATAVGDVTRPLPPPSRPRARTSERVASAPADEAGAPTELSREVEAARADPSRHFGPFLLLSPIGRGGMGVVFRAWNERLRRVVALKTILESEDLPRESVERFRREAEAAARLRHPGIVSVHEAGELSGKHYMAMDFVAGETLERRLAPKDGREKIALTKALEVVRDVARAVEHAHSQGVVHRDLKPANIIIDESGRALVLDFGLASVRGSGTKVTRTGVAMGTPAYMSPEQANGERADERSDVYSLGATLYHVLTGKPPFSGTDVNLVVAVLTRDPVSPGRANPRAAGDLETICMKCLEKEPSRRYASAAALAADLDAHLRGDPIAARPLGAVTRLARRIRRNKLATALLLLLAVGLVVAAAFVHEATARDEAMAREKTRAVEAAKQDERAKALERARATALSSWKKLGAARAAGGEDAVAPALDALEAASRALSLAPADADLRRRSFDAGLALGEAALETDAWSLAAFGFRAASSAAEGPEKARAEGGLARVRAAHERVSREIDSLLARAREGRLDEAEREDAVYAICRRPDPETVSKLSRELESVAAELEHATRKLYEQGADLLPGSIPGFEEALAAWKPGLPPRAPLVIVQERLVARAEERSQRIAARPPTLREIIAAAQGKVLGGRTVLESVACEALGRIGIARGAIEPLGKVLTAEEDELRAVAPASALCRLALADGSAAPRAIELVELARERFRTRSSSWIQVQRVYELVGSPSGEREPETADGFLSRGLRRADHKDLDGAISDFDRAIQLEPRNTAGFIRRGIVRMKKGDADGAIADQSQAIELDPRCSTAYTNRGSARNLKGDLDGALADFRRAIELDPRSALAFLNRGRARETKGDIEGALSDYGRASELDPRYTNAFLCRGDLRLAKGDLEGAAADFARAIELDPKSSQAFNKRALVKQRRGDTEGATADWTRAIELDPKYAIAYANRCLARQERGDLDGALLDANRAVELDGKNPAFFFNRGIVRRGKGDLLGALADYDRVVELDPRDSHALTNRASTRAALGDLKGAIADCDRAIEVDPRDTVAVKSRGLYRADSGDRKHAREDLARFLELAPGDPEAAAMREAIEKLKDP